MDAFEQNKYSEAAFFKLMLSNFVIVSYGTITAIDFDSVEVTLSVSNKKFADKVNCTFMSLGNEQFSLSFKPAINMQVVVFSPHKGANGMYESFKQLKTKTGTNFISTGSSAVYSSQQAFCFPLLKLTSLALSSLLVDNKIITLELAHSLVSSINGTVDIIINNDTVIEFNEGSKHTRNFEGDLEETFGMVEGSEGTEKQGTYLYEETYGKYSTVKKNFESGLDIVVGKAYEKPFLENKGSLIDSSAPVTIELGANAPATMSFGSPVTINLDEEAPLTLVYGDDLIKITVDKDTGFDISVTGSKEINLSAKSGKLKFSNSNGSLKDIFDKIADMCSTITTIGPNVVPAVPYAAGVDPATAAKFSVELKAFVAGILK